jgi:hypothetical protein
LDVLERSRRLATARNGAAHLLGCWEGWGRAVLGRGLKAGWREPLLRALNEGLAKVPKLERTALGTGKARSRGADLLRRKRAAIVDARSEKRVLSCLRRHESGRGSGLSQQRRGRV